MITESDLKIARELVDEWLAVDVNDVIGLTNAIATALADQRNERKKFCPCGGIILADTEDCKTPVCCNCAEEIVKAMKDQRETWPADDEAKAYINSGNLAEYNSCEGAWNEGFMAAYNWLSARKRMK